VNFNRIKKKHFFTCLGILITVSRLVVRLSLPYALMHCFETDFVHVSRSTI